MRHLNAVLETELQRAGRFDYPVSLLMIDVDHLRRINGAHGHLAGDRALLQVTKAVLGATREYDIAARFGGDEFCVLLPHTAVDGAQIVAERIRAERRAGRDASSGLTVSVGVASVPAGGAPEELITLADRAAYRAKFSGRNTVATAPEGDPVVEAERAREASREAEPSNSLQLAVPGLRSDEPGVRRSCAVTVCNLDAATKPCDRCASRARRRTRRRRPCPRRRACAAR